MLCYNHSMNEWTESSEKVAVRGEVTPGVYGRMIAAKREKLGLSQANLAKLLEKHVTYISKIERGQYVPNLKMASRLATFLQEEPREFLRLTLSLKSELPQTTVQGSETLIPQIQGYSGAELMLLSKIRLLSSEGRAFIEKCVNVTLSSEGKKEISKSNLMNPALQADREVSPSSKKAFYFYSLKTTAPNISNELVSSLAAYRIKKRALSVTPKSALFAGAKRAYLAGQRENAIKIFERILEHSKMTEKELRQIAEFLLEKKEIELARRYLIARTLEENASVLLLGKILRLEGEFDEALDLYGRYLKTTNDPDSKALLLVKTAEIYFDKKQQTSAVKALKDIDLESLKDSRNRNKVASFAITLDELEIAEKAIGPLLKEKKEKYLGLRINGLIQLRRRAYSDLENTAEELLILKPNEAVTYIFGSLASFLNGSPDKMIEWLEQSHKAIFTYPAFWSEMCGYALANNIAPKRIISVLLRFKDAGDESLFETLARAYFQDDQPTEAISIAKNGLGRFRNSRPISNELARMYLNQKQYSLAEAVLQGLSSDFHPITFYLLGICNLKQQKYDSAIEHLEAVVKDCPKWIQARDSLSDALRKNKKFVESRALLLEGLKEDPENEDLLSSLGMTFLEMCSYEQAMSTFKRLVHQSPKDSAHWYYLGFAAVRLGDYQSGEDAFRRCVELDAQDWFGLNSLGYTLNMKGDYSGAIPYLHAALEMEASLQNRGVSYSNLSHSFVKLGRLEDALGAVRKAVDLDTAWAETHYNYSLVLIAMGDLEKAQVELEEAIRLDEEGVCKVAAARRLRQILETRNKP